MEICSQDAELETTFQNWLGPKNESTYDLCKRLYNGLTDRVCRPPRKVYPDCEYEKEGWHATRFSLRTSMNLNLACIFYEKEQGGEEDTEAALCGFRDSEGGALKEAAGEKEPVLKAECEEEYQKEEKVSNTVPAERSNTDMSSNKSKVSPATHARHARMSLAGRDNFADRQKRKEKHMQEQEGDGGIVAKVYLRMAKADAAIVIMVITFYVLFGDDIRLALTGKSADGAFDALNVISLFVFLFELAVTYAADPKYRFSF